jgi:methylthioribose-1-phosphate isomerase
VAILARYYGIPFYVAAPSSTFDPDTPDGSKIPVEDRPSREVTHVGDVQITPDGVEVFNFAFDITPNELIAGIVTEKGVISPPYRENIGSMIFNIT